MQPEIHKYLFDIQIAIDSIYEYLGDKRDLNAYRQNKLVRRGVERELEIMGEAVGKILMIDPDIPITNARRIVDLRNWVIHGYDKVDDIIIWGIIANHLPKLKEDIERLLG